jgi:hypothetical protein
MKAHEFVKKFLVKNGNKWFWKEVDRVTVGMLGASTVQIRLQKLSGNYDGWSYIVNNLTVYAPILDYGETELFDDDQDQQFFLDLAELVVKEYQEELHEVLMGRRSHPSPGLRLVVNKSES